MAKSPRISKKTQRSMLEKMLLIRRFEERAAVAYGLRKIGGFCHLYIGQEAVAVGAIEALDLVTDYVVTAYRDHGHALACGMSPEECMAELFGKETGCSRGKGGSMHFFSAEKHMMGGNGIVGAQIPTGVGLAFKLRYNEEAGVALAFFGDGAIHQGSFHESINLARIWNLPVIFVCENNHYAMGTAVERVSSQPDFYKMGEAYQVEGELVDGMDALEIHALFSRLRKRMIKTPGPFLVEARTYRYKGHSMSDPAKYRSKDEVKQHQLRDPIERLKAAMIDAGDLSEKAFATLDAKIKQQVEASVEFADSSDPPSVETRFEDVLL